MALRLRKQKSCYGLYYNDYIDKHKPYLHIKTRLLDSTDIFDQFTYIDIYGETRFTPSFEHENIEYKGYYGIFRNRLNFGEIVYGLDNYGVYKPWFNYLKNINEIQKKDIRPIFKIVDMLERPEYLNYVGLFTHNVIIDEIGIKICIVPSLYDYVYDKNDINNLQDDKSELIKNKMVMYDTVNLKSLHKFRFVLYLKGLDNIGIDIYTFSHLPFDKKLKIYNLIIKEITIFMNNIAGVELDSNLITIYFNIDIKYDTMQVIFYFFNNNKDVLYQSIYETSHFIPNIMMKNIIESDQDLYVSLQLTPEKMEEYNPLDPLYMLYKHHNLIKMGGGPKYRLIKHNKYNKKSIELSKLLDIKNMKILSKYHTVIDLQIICSDIILLQDIYNNYYEIIIKNTSVDVIDKYLKNVTMDKNKLKYVNNIINILRTADTNKLSIFTSDCFVEILVRKYKSRIPINYDYYLPTQIYYISYIESFKDYNDNYKKCVQRYENNIDNFLILFAIYVVAIKYNFIEIINIFKKYFTNVELMNKTLLNVFHIISDNFYIRPKFQTDKNFDNYVLWYLPNIIVNNITMFDNLLNYMVLDENNYDKFYDVYKQDKYVKTLLSNCTNYKEIYNDFIHNFRDLTTEYKIEIDNLINFFLRHNYLSQLYGNPIFIINGNEMYKALHKDVVLNGYSIINIQDYHTIPYQEIVKNKYFIHANYPNASSYSIFHLQIVHNYDSIHTIKNKFKTVDYKQLFIQLMYVSNNQINMSITRVLPWNYLSKYSIDNYKIVIPYEYSKCDMDKLLFINSCPELLNSYKESNRNIIFENKIII